MIVEIVDVDHIVLGRPRKDGRGKAFVVRQRPDPGTDNHARTSLSYRHSWFRPGKPVDKGVVFCDISKVELLHSASYTSRQSSKPSKTKVKAE